MGALDVYLNGDHIGALADTAGGQLRFTYTPDWLARGDAVPLSKTLPLQAEPFDEKTTRPFFAGVLPEAEPRAGVARRLGISEGNDYAMLEHIGGECAGAVCVLPEEEVPAPIERRARALSSEDLARIITQLPQRPLLAGEDGVRLSLAGAQDKLPVIIAGEAISVPLGNTPSTHIIKPEPQRFPGLVANEAFCMGLAKRVGLNVATTTVRQFAGIPCIISSRYDREQMGDGSHRLHQEDFCQALGRPPERKYQQEGGPNVRECVNLLREWSTTPVLDILAFVDALIFNMLIGNADAHGKNFAILDSGGERRLAPLYDLVSTVAWPEISTRFAMNIGHGKQVNDVRSTHFKRMAEECALGWPRIRDRVAELSIAVEKGLSDLEVPSYGDAGSKMLGQLRDLVSQRCAKMLV